MSGREATRHLLAAAAREDVVEISLVARALGVSGKRLVRDWRKRKLPETRIGRTIHLSSDLVLLTYFQHHRTNSPAT